MKEVMTEIYPKELVLDAAPFLDLHLLITEGVISTSIYDKRDALIFLLSIFPTCQAISQKKLLMEHSFVN